MNQAEPLISVVIPTINRPHLVTRAVRSVLTQTLSAIEVIVVVDGPEDSTVQAIRHINDSRVRLLTLPENVGVGVARNTGINQARSAWVALLDDDDEWLPRKLEMQLQTAQQSPYRYPIISCTFIARTQDGEVILPRRLPAPNEVLSEYLFCQKGVLGGEGIILPSTIFTKKELLQHTPFRYRQLAHEGSDWLLRATQRAHVGVEFVATCEPLVIWHAEETHRMSHTSGWQHSLSWLEANSHLLTSRAAASFILIRASLEAQRASDWSAFWRLLWEAFRRGRPTVMGILAHMVIWLVPQRMRFKMAAFLTARRARAA
jgi:glycosyltransferase involved in cell wall biosynthesis